MHYVTSGSSSRTLCSGAHQHFQQVTHLPWCLQFLCQWSRYIFSFGKCNVIIFFMVPYIAFLNSLMWTTVWFFIMSLHSSHLQMLGCILKFKLSRKTLNCTSNHIVPLMTCLLTKFKLILKLMLQSTGAYKAASRLAIATPPPAYVLSRGIGWQVSYLAQILLSLHLLSSKLSLAQSSILEMVSPTMLTTIWTILQHIFSKLVFLAGTVVFLFETWTIFLLLWQGIGILLDGLFGTGTGSTVSV